MSSLQQSYLFRSLENAAMQAPDFTRPAEEFFSDFNHQLFQHKNLNTTLKFYRIFQQIPMEVIQQNGITSMGFVEQLLSSTHFVTQFGRPRCFASAFHRGQQASFPQSGHVLRHSESHLAVCTMGYQTLVVPTLKVAVFFH